MNKDTVIALARKAAGGMLSYDAEGCWRLSESEVERFAALVAAHTKEECAKAVQVMALANPGMMYMTADQCASIILKEKNT